MSLKPKPAGKFIDLVGQQSTCGTKENSVAGGVQEKPLALKTLGAVPEEITDMQENETAEKWKQQQVPRHSTRRASNLRWVLLGRRPICSRASSERANRLSNARAGNKLLAVNCGSTTGVNANGVVPHAEGPNLSQRHLLIFLPTQA